MSTEETGARATNRELLIESIVIMIVAAILYGVTYTFDRVPAILAQGIQPTAYPRAVLILMFGLAALQAFRSLRLSPGELAKAARYRRMPRFVFLTVGFLVLFLIAMPTIGTFPTVAIFCPALALLWGERRWLLMALSFAGFLAFAYALFRLLMNVPMP